MGNRCGSSIFWLDSVGTPQTGPRGSPRRRLVRLQAAAVLHALLLIALGHAHVVELRVALLAARAERDRQAK